LICLDFVLALRVLWFSACVEVCFISAGTTRDHPAIEVRVVDVEPAVAEVITQRFPASVANSLQFMQHPAGSALNPDAAFVSGDAYFWCAFQLR
jgi:hypothetical protein